MISREVRWGYRRGRGRDPFHGETLNLNARCKFLRGRGWMARLDPYICITYGSSEFQIKQYEGRGSDPIFVGPITVTFREDILEIDFMVWNRNFLLPDKLIGSGRIKLDKSLIQTEGVNTNTCVCIIEDRHSKFAGVLELDLVSCCDPPAISQTMPSESSALHHKEASLPLQELSAPANELSLLKSGDPEDWPSDAPATSVKSDPFYYSGELDPEDLAYLLDRASTFFYQRKTEFAEAVPTKTDVLHVGTQDSEVSSTSGLSDWDMMQLDFDSYLKLKGAVEVVFSFYDHEENIQLLITRMIDAGIEVFRDNRKVHECGKIDEEFMCAINNAKICIPVVSKKYASSKRCLLELACMVEARRKLDATRIVPIFYNVEPCEVNLQAELYTSSLVDHMENFSRETVEEWKEALKEVAGIEGWEMKSENFTKYTNLIVHGILTKLKVKHPSAHWVGMEDQVQSVKKLLDVESGGVLFVGIHGVSGIGKTTLAKVIFNELFDYFEGCCFLNNIRETSERWGPKYFQDQLRRDIPEVGDNDHEIKGLKDINKKVLIVLDDVDKREQINKLVGKASWFGSGSRIIVTARDENVLPIEHDNCYFTESPVHAFNMREMDHGHALQLFCRHAFGKDSPPYDYIYLSNELIDAIGKLPLALEVVGSFLNRKDRVVWYATLVRLKRLPLLEIKEKLMISYDSLEDETKKIFLDIACFFNGKDQTYPVYMWNACNLFPSQGIEVLMFMSLVKIVDDNKLWMHDQVRDFGREIARQESVDMDPAKCSRLWVHEEAIDILRRKEVDQKKEHLKVEALSLCYDDSLWGWTFTHEQFESLPDLRFLELCGVHFAGDFKQYLSNLRWLSWHFCPKDFGATNINLTNLVILDLSRSQISHDWGGWYQIAMATNLKVLNLTSCKNLICTPDLSSYKALERLVLEDCNNLTEIGSSFAKLERLKYLNLKGCNSLKELPNEIGHAKNLVRIVMNGNGRYFTLPESISSLTSLAVLDITDTGIEKLPSSIGGLLKLEHLSLSACFRMQELPTSLGYLTSLVKLDLGRTEISWLPDSFGNLKKLKVLKVECSLITGIPRSFGMLEKLEELHARKCEKLEGEVPAEIGRLSYLRIIDLSFTNISSLPRTIRQLSLLQTLYLESCNKLKELPELPQSLVSLHITQEHDCSNLSKVHSPINYGQLGISVNINQIRHWIGKLCKLQILELCIPDIPVLELSPMPQLRSLFLSCLDLKCLLQLPPSLSKLILEGFQEKTKVPTLHNLKKLTSLEFYNCSINNGLESLGVEQIESLEHLSASRCYFSRLNGFNLPKSMKVLRLSECELLEEIDLSGLKNLIHLELTGCETLKEIRGLGELLCLEEIIVCDCNSLVKMGDLSRLRKLETLELSWCEKLQEVKGIDKVESLRHLQICGCKSLESFSNKLETKNQRKQLQTKA